MRPSPVRMGPLATETRIIELVNAGNEERWAMRLENATLSYLPGAARTPPQARVSFGRDALAALQTSRGGMPAAFRRLLVDGLLGVAGNNECVHTLLAMLEEPGGMFDVVELRSGHRACRIPACLVCAQFNARHGTGGPAGPESAPAVVRTDP
jgi:hypothetical protein